MENELSHRSLIALMYFIMEAAQKVCGTLSMLYTNLGAGHCIGYNVASPKHSGRYVHMQALTYRVVGTQWSKGEG